MDRHVDHALVDDIRGSSRRIVRELGFLHSTLAATEYRASAVHALIELGERGPLAADDLARALALNKSSMRRMLRDLIDNGELAVSDAPGDDGRPRLALTARGRGTLAGIDAYGRTQVGAALEHLDTAECRVVSAGLSAYARALSRRERDRPTADRASGVAIAAGYRPGIIGGITDLHAAFYHRHAGFGQYFESQVAAGLAEFASRLGHERNGVWSAWRHGRVVGAVAIDGEHMGAGIAHLRWFIVDDAVRGGGIGRKLLAQAMSFCDRNGFAETRLWTFAGLDAARRLYEENGFRLAEERVGRQWGEAVTEQLFVRSAGSV